MSSARGKILNETLKAKRLESYVRLPVSLQKMTETPKKLVKSLTEGTRSVWSALSANFMSMIFPEAHINDQVRYVVAEEKESMGREEKIRGINENLPFKRLPSPVICRLDKVRKIESIDCEAQTEFPYDPKMTSRVIIRNPRVANKPCSKIESIAELDTKGTDEEEEELCVKKKLSRKRAEKNWIHRGPQMEVIPEVRVKRQVEIAYCGQKSRFEGLEVIQEEGENDKKPRVLETTERSKLKDEESGFSGLLEKFGAKSETVAMKESIFAGSPKISGGSLFSFAGSPQTIMPTQLPGSLFSPVSSSLNFSMAETPQPVLTKPEVSNPIPTEASIFKPIPSNPEPAPSASIPIELNKPKDPIILPPANTPVIPSPVKPAESVALEPNPAPSGPISCISTTIHNLNTNPFLNSSVISSQSLPYKFGAFPLASSPQPVPLATIQPAPISTPVNPPLPSHSTHNSDIDMGASTSFSSPQLTPSCFTPSFPLFQSSPNPVFGQSPVTPAPVFNKNPPFLNAFSPNAASNGFMPQASPGKPVKSEGGFSLGIVASQGTKRHRPN